jgi:DNA-binding SARP family transcriptional activator
MIELRTLGAIEVVADGVVAPPDLLWRKNLALLVYLARSPRRSRSREHLMGLLWGDRPEAAARRSLSQALYVLRQHLGEAAIEARGGVVHLDAGALRFDCDQFGAYAAEGDWGAAAALVAGEFLEGFAVPDATEFETWLAAERAAWRRRGVEALVRQAEALLARGDVAGATVLAERAVVLSPTSDAAVRALMLGQALAGDRAGALAAYDVFATTLREEVATTPETETERLAERVRRERGYWRSRAEACSVRRASPRPCPRRWPPSPRASLSGVTASPRRGESRPTHSRGRWWTFCAPPRRSSPS